ncbi:uncharacterized protein LOC121425406 [Lytechinus variegatus]|uniref:uncharacterized protein LOC121425406 n=1 Tax=Lytechinus variegatus TaxID=7654 RepID=UPI001BB1B7FE|nr:uncharacterized protein LOC121425406 [Lytechinus variegatus]
MVPTVIISLTFFSILAFFGIPLNAVTIRVILKRRRKTSTQIFIIILAMTDLFVCIVTPMLWYILVLTDMFFTDISCMTITFIAAFSLLQSIFIGATIALDRYFLICRPYSQFMTKKRVIAIMVACLIFSFILAFLVAYHSKARLYKNNAFKCDLAGWSIVFERMMIAVMVICGSCMVVLYWKVYRALRVQRNRVMVHMDNNLRIPSNRSQTGESSTTRKDSVRIEIKRASLDNTVATGIEIPRSSHSSPKNYAQSSAKETQLHGGVKKLFNESLTPANVVDVHNVNATQKTQLHGDVKKLFNESLTLDIDDDVHNVNAAQKTQLNDNVKKLFNESLTPVNDVDVHNVNFTQETQLQGDVTELFNETLTPVNVHNVNVTEETQYHDDVKKLFNESLTPVNVHSVSHVNGACTSTGQPPFAPSHSKSTVDVCVVTRHRSADINNAERSPAPVTTADRQATNIMLVITGVFLITWIPSIVVNLIPVDALVEMASTNNHLYLFVFFLQHTVYISMAVNPLVYGFMNTRFRKECLNEIRYLRSCLDCWSS